MNMNNVIKLQRNIGIDLLRILLALMVIAIHFNAPGTGKVADAVTAPPLFYLVNIMVAFCYPAVNTYVLITGYYSHKKQKTYSQIFASLVKLWMCLLFYQIIGYWVAVIFNGQPLSIDFILRFFPLSRGVWWFMTDYFILLLISPMINLVIDTYSKRENILFLLLFLLLFSFIPFFIKWDDVIGLNDGYGIVWFVVLYYTGALLHKYSKYTCNNLFSKYFICGILGFVLVTIILLLTGSIFSRIVFLKEFTLYRYNSILVYAQAVLLFIAFWNLEIHKECVARLVCSMAGLSLAAYIFHCQEDIAVLLWDTTNPSHYANDLYIIPLFFYVVLGVYSLSISIEFVRRKLYVVVKCEDRITNKLIRICSELIHRLVKN